MFEKLIDEMKNDMLRDLGMLIKIPSVCVKGSSEKPYGDEVNTAFETAVHIAEHLGFKARNLKRLTEVSFGEGSKKAYIACHLDIVDASSGWKHKPFSLTEDGEYLYGRGVLDNKGPAVAVLYAMNAVKKAGYEPKVSLKLLLGGAEETGMDDLPFYMKNYGYPDFALTPDSLFPIVNTEAGIFSGRIEFDNSGCEEKVLSENKLNLISFNGGNASNSVPDSAEAVIKTGSDNSYGLYEYIETLKKDEAFKHIKATTGENKIILFSKGLSAHASAPDDGINAITQLAKFIYKLYEHTGCKNSLIDILTKYFCADTDGGALGIRCKGEILGKSTLNVGLLNYEKGFFTVDMRIPCHNMTDKIKSATKKTAETYGFKLIIDKIHDYTHVPADSEFMIKLSEAYEQSTKLKAEFLGSKGLTYSKVLGGKGVAFGPVTDDNGDEGGGLHGDDEFIKTETLLKLAKTYAYAIYKLWC